MYLFEVYSSMVGGIVFSRRLVSIVVELVIFAAISIIRTNRQREQ